MDGQICCEAFAKHDACLTQLPWDRYMNGFGQDLEDLGGSVAVHQRETENGLVTSFAMEINFRSFTSGTAKLLRNALTTSTKVQRGATATGTPPEFVTASFQNQLEQRWTVAANRTADEKTEDVDWTANIQIVVQNATLGDVDRVDNNIRMALRTVVATRSSVPLPRLVKTTKLRGYTGHEGGQARLVFAVPHGVPGKLEVDEHPWVGMLPTALTNAGIGNSIVVVF